MMMSWLSLLIVIIGVGSYALFLTLLKKTKTDLRPVVFFWVYAISYGIYTSIYLLRSFIFKKQFNAIEKLVHHYTFENAPLYIVIGIISVASLVILLKLFKKYSALQVTALSQISILFTTLALYILKLDAFSWNEFIGVLIICVGILMIATDSLNILHPMKLIKSIPKPLLQGTLLLGALKSASTLITIIVTEESPTSDAILKTLKYVYPFEHHQPFLQNLGIRFFVTLAFYWYIHHNAKYKKEIMPTFKKHTTTLILASIIFLISIYGIQVGSLYTDDLTVMAALGKLNLPFLIIFSNIMLNEKITVAKISGALLVIVGGILMAMHHI